MQWCQKKSPIFSFRHQQPDQHVVTIPTFSTHRLCNRAYHYFLPALSYPPPQVPRLTPRRSIFFVVLCSLVVPFLSSKHVYTHIHRMMMRCEQRVIVRYLFMMCVCVVRTQKMKKDWPEGVPRGEPGCVGSLQAGHHRWDEVFGPLAQPLPRARGASRGGGDASAPQ